MVFPWFCHWFSHWFEVEMAIASFAHFFLAFGDGIVQGHVSKPSLLTMQMRPVMNSQMG